MLFLIQQLVLTSLIHAHCPLTIEHENGSYCADILWHKTEKKNKTVYTPTENNSPYWIVKNTVPQNWQYSVAEIRVWASGDASHSPVQIPEFRAFPYMFMSNGHHHSASHNFEWNSETQSYFLSNLGLVEMSGCWTLRWGYETHLTFGSTHHLQIISNYSNLDPETNEVLNAQCQDLIPDGESDLDHTHQH